MICDTESKCVKTQTENSFREKRLRRLHYYLKTIEPVKRKPWHSYSISRNTQGERRQCWISEGSEEMIAFNSFIYWNWVNSSWLPETPFACWQVVCHSYISIKRMTMLQVQSGAPYKCELPLLFSSSLDCLWRKRCGTIILEWKKNK